jgi:hypothetical protein
LAVNLGRLTGLKSARKREKVLRALHCHAHDATGCGSASMRGFVHNRMPSFVTSRSRSRSRYIYYHAHQHTGGSSNHTTSFRDVLPAYICYIEISKWPCAYVFT